jgi:inosose dehydratase
VSTYVETPGEVKSLLDRTDVGLTLDTGHLLLGGGDPVEALSWMGTRVNHVHLKDTRVAVLDQGLTDGADMRGVWERNLFPPLGAGDLDLSGFMEALEASGYGGWLVVEQDVIPATDAAYAQAIEDQRTNRDALTRWVR